MNWSKEQVDAFNAKKGKLPPTIPVIPAGNSGKAGNYPQNRAFALGRMKAGKMNKTESLYRDLLERRKMAGEVIWYEFEPFNLRLGEKCFYSPDFLIMLKSGELECHEIKGHLMDDSLVKFKVAREKFPFRFRMIRLVKGNWEEIY